MQGRVDFAETERGAESYPEKCRRWEEFSSMSVRRVGADEMLDVANTEEVGQGTPCVRCFGEQCFTFDRGVRLHSGVLHMSAHFAGIGTNEDDVQERFRTC